MILPEVMKEAYLDKLRRDLEELAVTDEERACIGSQVDTEAEFIREYHEFQIEWLNQNIGHDQTIITRDRQQIMLTDRAGEGNLPVTHAVHAIGKPIRKQGDHQDINTVQVNDGG
jgi:hypothetical protein